MKSDEKWNKVLDARRALEKAEKEYFNTFRADMSDETISNRSKKAARTMFQDCPFVFANKDKIGSY